MVEWITVLSLLLFGMALIIAEIIFVPGTTAVGLVGFVFLVVGTGLSFHYFGSETGWITTGGTAVASGVILYFAFKANVWGHFSLKTTNTGKVNEEEMEALEQGTEGIALSALRPIGKAELGNRTYEVRTMGNYVEAGTKIRVMQIQSHQIIVEPLK
jgi:membrane-bound ClpP family serine protease